MTIPSFSDFHQPILEYLYQKNTVTQKELMHAMVNHFSLSEEDIKEKVSSGQTVLYSRVSWSRTYLERAGLLEKAGRGISRISEEGKRVFESGDIVTTKYLERYEGFREFNAVKQKEDRKITESDCQATPEETLEEAVRQINSKLESDILEEIMNQTPEFFEHLVTDLLAKIYGGEFEENNEVTGRSGDEGIDGIIKKDRLGFDNIYVQAKRWANNVQRNEIQKFSGALDGQNANNGAFITTSDFANTAKEYAKGLRGKHIVLINGKELAKLIIEYDIGLSSKRIIDIKKIDYDYFNPEI